MATNDYLPGPDAQLGLWLANYASVATANASTLGLSPAELTTIQSASEDFNDALDVVQSAFAAYQGEVQNKQSKRNTVVQIVRSFTREFKANPTVPEALLAQLGVLTNNTSGPVKKVTGLVAVGCSNGTNQLSWNRNGNSSNTIFIIEAKLGDSNDWEVVTVTTRTKFNHEDQTPGLQISYRINSNRAGVSSGPCDPFVLYPGGGQSANLSIAA